MPPTSSSPQWSVTVWRCDSRLPLSEWRRLDGSKRLDLEGPSGADHLTVDEILVAVGRTPNIEDLGLDAAGVDHDRAGVTVNDFLQTTNRRIYASGDVCLAHKFTHTADATSRAILQNALFPGPKKRLSKLVVPWCTYTDPEIAHVGIYEREAEERGIDVTTIEISMSEVDRALAEGHTDGFLKVHLKKGTDAILGATIVARHAGDLISEITTAMVGRVGSRVVLGSHSPLPHPRRDHPQGRRCLQPDQTDPNHVKTPAQMVFVDALRDQSRVNSE